MIEQGPGDAADLHGVVAAIGILDDAVVHLADEQAVEPGDVVEDVGVIAGSADERVEPAAAIERVAAIQADERVGGVVAGELVFELVAGQVERIDPDDDSILHVVGQRILGVIEQTADDVPDRYHIHAFVGRLDDGVVALPDQDPAGGEPGNVLQQVGIVIGAADEHVQATKSVQLIRAGTALEAVACVVADQQIVAGAADRVLDDDTEVAVAVEVRDVGGDGEAAGDPVDGAEKSAAPGPIAQRCRPQIDGDVTRAGVLDSVDAAGVPDAAVGGSGGIIAQRVDRIAGVARHRSVHELDCGDIERHRRRGVTAIRVRIGPGSPVVGHHRIEARIQPIVAGVRWIARATRINGFYPRKKAGAHTEVMRMGQAEGMSKLV